MKSVGIDLTTPVNFPLGNPMLVVTVSQEIFCVTVSLVEEANEAVYGQSTL